ncbi:unnamed protein product [Paramecium sonneborni]|uniref:Protein kinase domain-containing protein n=1 Tax=Paramecium sonneborni TaxID=65129 RepID=A0A8S1R733_9CILI|nr:unnamed protein product [Paramecium sonneborni]
MNEYCFYDYVINLEKKIGQGQFGIVVECYHKTKYKDIKLCAKIVQNATNIDESMMKEIQILRKIKSFNNKHLIKVYDMFEAENKFFIIMERCLGGELKHLITERQKNGQLFKTNEILDFVYQFIDGYQILYDNMIMHRDIKPQNIFVDLNLVYKIGDLGAGRILEDVKKQGDYTKIGSPIYSSPQVLKLQNFSSQTDVYSLGMVLYQLTFLDFPFKAVLPQLQKFITQLQLQKKFSLDQLEKQIENEGSQKEKDEIKFLIENMLVFEEKERISWDQLFKRMRNENVYAQFRLKYEDNTLEQSLQILEGKKQKKRQKETEEVKVATSLFQKNLDVNQIVSINSQPNQERKRSPLSQYLKIQQCKVNIVQKTLNYLKDVAYQSLLSLQILEYLLILSSLYGYQYNLIRNIDAIHKGDYNQLSEHIRQQRDKQNQNIQVILDFQQLKTEDDIKIRDYTANILSEFLKNNFIAISQTIQKINEQKIRFQSLCQMRDLLLNFQTFSNYYSYWEFICKFFQSYLQRQFNQLLFSDINQYSDSLLLFMVYMYDLCGLEEKYKQLELFKENKIQIIPQQNYSRQDAINYLINKRNDLQQQQQQQFNQNKFY